MHLSVVKLGTTVSLNDSNLTVMHGMENMKFLSHAKRIKSFTDFNIFVLFILLYIFTLSKTIIIEHNSNVINLKTLLRVWSLHQGSQIFMVKATRVIAGWFSGRSLTKSSKWYN